MHSEPAVCHMSAERHDGTCREVEGDGMGSLVAKEARKVTSADARQFEGGVHCFAGRVIDHKKLKCRLCMNPKALPSENKQT